MINAARHIICVNPGVYFWTRKKSQKSHARSKTSYSVLRTDVLELRQSIYTNQPYNNALTIQNKKPNISYSFVSPSSSVSSRLLPAPGQKTTVPRCWPIIRRTLCPVWGAIITRSSPREWLILALLLSWGWCLWRVWKGRDQKIRW